MTASAPLRAVRPWACRAARLTHLYPEQNLGHL